MSANADGLRDAASRPNDHIALHTRFWVNRVSKVNGKRMKIRIIVRVRNAVLTVHPGRSIYM